VLYKAKFEELYAKLNSIDELSRPIPPLSAIKSRIGGEKSYSYPQTESILDHGDSPIEYRYESRFPPIRLKGTDAYSDDTDERNYEKVNIRVGDDNLADFDNDNDNDYVQLEIVEGNVNYSKSKERELGAYLKATVTDSTTCKTNPHLNDAHKKKVFSSPLRNPMINKSLSPLDEAIGFQNEQLGILSDRVKATNKTMKTYKPSFRKDTIDFGPDCEGGY